MLAETTERIMLNEHTDEINRLVKGIVGTDEKPGSMNGADRLIQLHISMAVYYVRKISTQYKADVDVVMSDYLYGMFDACRKLHAGIVKPTSPSGYLLSHGRSVAINKMENPSSGWKRTTYLTAKRNGHVYPQFASINFETKDANENDGVYDGYEDAHHPTVKDDTVDVMMECEDLVAELTEKQREVLVALAKGCTDTEAARETGLKKSKFEVLRSQIIMIMEERRRRRKKGI